MNYQELPPQERMVIIAKIYHNIWYDEYRYAVINNLLEEWDREPVKDCKFLNDIDNGKELCKRDIPY